MAAMFLSLHGLQEVCRTELLSHPKEEEDGESAQAPSGQVSCPNPATCPASFMLGVLLLHNHLVCPTVLNCMSPLACIISIPVDGRVLGMWPLG